MPRVRFVVYRLGEKAGHPGVSPKPVAAVLVFCYCYFLLTSPGLIINMSLTTRHPLSPTQGGWVGVGVWWVERLLA